MRLQAIKLSGFKSFVDPTLVPFPSNLCAVVGPNGCGKSNIIDAVRWVMGESSVKTLRGESMTDVIFNGSSTRKPVGQASIELLFDNTEGRLGGEFAAYTEISIKRQVNREAQSGYFLNGQKVRRKDITDVFLGTGLGPRSYSIIEQGMISQLIEARPEDLRAYLEEAAGISKYKERRRETERRISHTRDNLDRLTDLRDELERQLHRLERQSRAAERYTGLKSEERLLKAQLSSLRWQEIDQKARGQEGEVQRLEVETEARVAEQRRIDAEIETARAVLADQQDEMNVVQKRYYDIGTEIARVEEALQHQQARESQLSRDHQELIATAQKLDADIEKDTTTLGHLDTRLADIVPRQEAVKSAGEESGRVLQEAETLMARLQVEWDGFNETAAASGRAAEVEQSRIAHLEQSIERFDARLRTARADEETLAASTTASEIGPLAEVVERNESAIRDMEESLTGLTGQIETQRSTNDGLADTLNSTRGELLEANGVGASLEALQKAALGREDDTEMRWLEAEGLADASRLGESIRVDEPWDGAVEMVLGGHLQAVCLDQIDSVAMRFAEVESGTFAFVESRGGQVSALAIASSVQPSSLPGSLLGKVQTDLDLTSLLGCVRTAESVSEALAMRRDLGAGESVITVDGIWLGSHWVRVARAQEASDGIIRRQAAIDALKTAIEGLEDAADVADLAVKQGVEALKGFEYDRGNMARKLAEAQRAHGEARANLAAKRVQAQQVAADLARARDAIRAGEIEIAEDQDALKAARGRLAAALDRMEEDTHTRKDLTRRRDDLRKRLVAARESAGEDRENVHRLALEIQSLQSDHSSTRQAVARLEAQRVALGERRESLEMALRETEGPRAALRQELDQGLAQRLTVETALTEARRTAEQTEHRVRALTGQRSGAEEAVQTARSSLEDVRLAWQALDVRRTTVAEQLVAEGFVIAELIEGLPDDASIAGWEEELERMDRRIQRLGPINLAAIDEFKVQSERKEYLDAQNEDLVKALTTLEGAIRKMDIETRTRFKETFDKVNIKLQQLFPKLFGGGHAYLQMTGEDLLDTGVGLMARPPGKRNTSIHLLSGGEKAMTAIALVFSIFSLNPAPFCLLDEVDAPLDDANVSRYAEMVKEMSRTVQFIYITHNKMAMEMAEQLMGVTMHEPGVSRLVSVDVEEAVAMAAV
jgi:chromosome segregation protein